MLSLHAKHMPQVAVGFRKSGRELDRLAKCGDGVVQLMFLNQGTAQGIVGQRVLGLQCDGRAEGRDGVIPPPLF